MRQSHDHESPYTTETLARLFGCAPGSIAKAIDRGVIRSYRVPGSRHRRVSRQAVAEYVESRDEPERSTLRKHLDRVAWLPGEE